MANLQNIDRVEPHPTLPGASLIRYRDGSTMSAPASVAAQFDPTRLSLAASGATAQNMSVAPPVGPNASVMPPQPAPPPRPPAGMSIDPSTVMTDAPTASTLAPGMQLSYPAAPKFEMAPARPQDPDPIDVDSGLRLSQLRELQSRRVATAGRKAYDPTKDDASRVAVREHQTEQRAGVQAWDEEAQLNTLINRREAIAAKAEADSLQTQSAAEAQRLYAADLKRQADEQAARQAAEEQAWKAEHERLVADARGIASAEVNPNRVFRDAQPWQGIGLAIAAGLKGWATQGRDNSVADQVQRMVDRDVRLQEAQINSQKADVDNALSRAMQRYGSIEAGRAAVRAAGLQAGLARLDSLKAQLGEKGNLAGIEATRKALEAEAYASFEQAKTLAQGTTTTATTAAMRAPQAAIAPGSRAMTQAEYDRALEAKQRQNQAGAAINAGRLGNEEKAISNRILNEQGVTPEQAAKRQDTLDSRVAEYGERRSTLESTATKLARLTADLGVKPDARGNLPTDADIAGFGAAQSMVRSIPLVGDRLANAATSSVGLQNRAAFESVVNDAVREAYGAANTEQKNDKVKEIIGDGTAAHILPRLALLMRDVQAKRDNLDASFDPEVRAVYNRNKRVSRRETDTKSKDFRPADLNAK